MVAIAEAEIKERKPIRVIELKFREATCRVEFFPGGRAKIIDPHPLARKPASGWAPKNEEKKAA